MWEQDPRQVDVEMTHVPDHHDIGFSHRVTGSPQADRADGQADPRYCSGHQEADGSTDGTRRCDFPRSRYSEGMVQFRDIPPVGTKAVAEHRNPRVQ